MHGITTFLGTLTGKLVLGTAIAAASVGGAQATGVVDVPGLPRPSDHPAVIVDTHNDTTDPTTVETTVPTSLNTQGTDQGDQNDVNKDDQNNVNEDDQNDVNEDDQNNVNESGTDQSSAPSGA